MSRPQNPEVRKRLLVAGLRLIHANSFNGIGVKDIAEAAGVPKGSFYNYFETKEEFGVAVLQHYWAAIERDYGPILDDLTLDPVERVAHFFHAMADDNELRSYALGCLIGDLALELASGSSETRESLAAILTRWEDLLDSCLRDAQDRGDLPAERDTREVAATIIEAWEGAVLRSKVEQERRSYARFESTVLPALLR